MNDIVERLRNHGPQQAIVTEAADEIERLNNLMSEIIDILDPDMSRRDIVSLREKLIRSRA